jgi:hypothetical protein
VSPFIVTTSRSCNCEPSTCESDGLLYHETRCSVFNVPRGERESRLAVATLEEAQTADALEGRAPCSPTREDLVYSTSTFTLSPSPVARSAPCRTGRIEVEPLTG